MPIPRLRRTGALALAALGIATAAPPTTAQYFGRNKVRYEAFRFELLRTKHFEVYFYPEEAAAAPIVARMAERWYVRHAAALRHELRGAQTLIVYASHPHFEQTNAIDGDIGEGTGGVTEALKRRIVMPLAGPLAETDHVLGHELVHAFQYDITGQGRGGLAAGARGGWLRYVRRKDGELPPDRCVSPIARVARRGRRRRRLLH